jgi:hypothetical protein
LTEIAVGLEETEKSGPTSRTDVVWVRVPLVPVTVKMYVANVVLLVLAVNMEVAVPPAGTVTDEVPSVQVMLEEQLLLRFTVPLNPFSDVTVTV